MKVCEETRLRKHLAEYLRCVRRAFPVGSVDGYMERRRARRVVSEILYSAQFGSHHLYIALMSINTAVVDYHWQCELARMLNLPFFRDVKGDLYFRGRKLDDVRKCSVCGQLGLALAEDGSVSQARTCPYCGASLKEERHGAGV